MQRRSKESEPEATPPPERAPYRRPQLRHLGSVRELTIGNTRGTLTDMNGQKMVGRM